MVVNIFQNSFLDLQLAPVSTSELTLCTGPGPARPNISFDIFLIYKAPPLILISSVPKFRSSKYS